MNIDELVSEYTKDEILCGEIPGCHGVAHWFKVAQLAVLIAAAEGGDIEVALLFGLYHDCRRKDNGYDLFHGERAAELVAHHYARGDLKISIEQKDKLVYACMHHTSGLVSDDPTISACWDADRLDLPRGGTQTVEHLLGTDIAKRLASTQEGFYYGT